MSKTTKPVRLCVEGATTDGRKVSRQWLTDIEKNYDPETYGARINLEHFNSPWMPRFGDVLSVFTEEIKEGQLAGKLALYGVLSPTDELIAMNKKRQKVYTSAEINPSFSDTGAAYLVGLAVTDNPASLGTSMLQFSTGNGATALSERKQSVDNIFTEAEETLFEFTEKEAEKTAGPSLYERIKAKFSTERKRSDESLKEVHESIEMCADEQTKTANAVADLTKKLAGLEAVKQENKTLRSELDELKNTLSQQDKQPHRPTSFGGQGENTENLTDC